MPAVRLSVLGRDDCAGTAAVRAALDEAGVSYDYAVLDADGTGPDGACGYTSPTVLVLGGYGGTRSYVQPDPVALLDDLEAYGMHPRRPRRRL